VGDPQRHFQAVHIAGTNGKGSTGAFLAAMLRAQGFRTGLYASPHLVSFTERMLVDGAPIPEAAVAAWTERLREEAEVRQATFFEITTAIAFADFAARGVEIAVIEVGLGGRLDATNVIEPLAAGLTRVEMDHQEYLGSTLEEIAREKAGIAKMGVPFLTTEPRDDLAAFIVAEAERRGASAARVSSRLAAGMELGLAGGFQMANAALAMALAAALPERWRPDAEAVRLGLKQARLSGRFERRGPYLFDVAHNPDGARALAAALEQEPLPRPLTGVIAVLRDKDWRAMLAALGPVLERVIVTRADTAPAERAWDLAEVVETLGREQPGIEACADLGDALRRARGHGGSTVVTGSFTTVGDAMRRLGLAP
jgi:dihydrofolate synthase/folylpolyglutamate synthase